jgi:hypothetical protein
VTAHNRKLKRIIFDLDGAEYQAQITSFKMVNGTEDPEITYTFEPGEEFADEADPTWTLDMSFVADWTVGGISTYLTEHTGEQVSFQLDLHPDQPTDHVRWSGQIKLKAPDVGGDVRTTEKTDMTFAIVGEPVFSRP